MLAAWFLINIIDRRNPALSFFLLAITLFFGGKIHYVFYYISPMAFLIIILSFGKNGATLDKPVNWKYITLFVGVLFLVVNFSPVREMLLNKYMSFNRPHILGAGTNYVKPIQEYANFTPIEYFLKYMFYPFPWLVNTPQLLFAFLCVGLRSLLLFFTVKRVFCGEVSSRVFECRALIYLALFVCFVCSQGTANYGTAFRHNILSYWVFAIFGIPEAMRIIASRVKIRKFIDNDKVECLG